MRGFPGPKREALKPAAKPMAVGRTRGSAAGGAAVWRADPRSPEHDMHANSVVRLMLIGDDGKRKSYVVGDNRAEFEIARSATTR